MTTETHPPDARPSATEAVRITPQDLLRFFTHHYMLILYLALLTGAVYYGTLRLVNFPIANGGYYYQLTQELIDNNFMIPPLSYYNEQSIPYAHPPLGFYITAGAARLFNWTLIDAFRWVPLWVSILIIGRVYRLAALMTHSKGMGFMAALIFMLMPNNIIWLISGGSVVHGSGLLLALWAIYYGHWLITTREERYLLPTALFLALTAATHADSLLFALYTLLLLLLIFGRSGYTVLHMLLLAVLTSVLLSVWLAPMLWIHGVTPFVNVISAAEWLSHPFEAIRTPNFTLTGEPFVPLIGFFGLLGFFVTVAKREWFLALWLVLSLAIYTQITVSYALLALALLAAIGMNQLVVPLLQAASRQHFEHGFMMIELYSQQQWLLRANRQLYRLPWVIFIAVFVGYSLYGITISTARFLDIESPLRLSAENRQGIDWLINNPELVPSSSVFLVLTPAVNWQTDPSTSWFPILAPYRSLSTVQGNGWLGNYREAKASYQVFHGCLLADTTCLRQEEAALQGINLRLTPDALVPPLYTHIYIVPGVRGALLEFLLQSDNHERIYNELGVQIFARRDIAPTSGS